ncbi:MAG: hypothetical protein K2Z81_07860 [Cyanobacteria bacterium]|nr:hypothetical protein [Cyanobacteriota bacterium]
MILRTVLVVLLLSTTCLIPALANPARLTTGRSATDDDLGIVSNNFDLLPPKKALKKEPEDVKIYDFDGTPLGNRAPLLLVHGLRGEFLPDFRWQKVSRELSRNKEVNSSYKIYCVRYATTRRLEGVIPKFRNAVHTLYNACNHKKITCIALSMGGNLVYESMLDQETNDRIAAVLTMGTPFHGSPLFCSDWLQYSLYKRLSLPLTRIDHSLALKVYFGRNKNLVADLGWDNFDGAVPMVGKFKSRLPFGPKGEVTEETTVNERLGELNNNGAEVKKKLLTYGTYLNNPYMEPKALRYIEKTFMYPLTLFWVKMPAHLGREHAVLNMLNHDIACVQVSKDWKDKHVTAFLYALNDGITPVSSALFLPESTLKSTAVIEEKDIKKLIGKTDVRLARVFKDADHLTYIDGFRPISASSKLVDELHPDEGEKEIFDWMIDDLLALHDSQERLAKDDSTKPAKEESEESADDREESK